MVVFLSCTTEDSFLEEEVIIVPNKPDSTNIAHNEWTYDQMTHHYFWNEDILDSLLLDFSINPRSFFERLLPDKDRFSWCEPNMNYTKGNWGFEYQAYKSHGSVVNRVLYVSSPYLKEQGLKRGDYIHITDSSIEKGTMQQGRFVVTEIIDRAGVNTRGTNFAPTIPLDSVYVIGEKKIGYFVYNGFEESTDILLIALRLKSQEINELIIDLRYNPGGYVSTCNDLASAIVPLEHLGKVFQKQEYNNILTKENQKDGGDGFDYVFLNDGTLSSLRNLNLQRLVVLTTKNTASASEGLIYGLRPYMEVATVGTKTTGKDVGSYTIADRKYKYQLQPITFRYYNALDEVVPASGIIPDIEVADDLEHERGDLNEALLSAAINYLLSGDKAPATRSASSGEREYGKSSIEIRNNL